MDLKILTVDDSRAVRIIVRKAFKAYNAEIIEAANGVEGLAAASKHKPDLVLLDITMPIMDGVEMLTKLKSDPATRSAPVIMLTAEAGREMVLKIAKLGIRDYIVKPFKEEVLTEKVGRIIDLRPLSETVRKRKTLEDECNVLVVEDKPAILEQIKSGLKGDNWKVHGVTSTGETIDFCQKNLPDAVLISLSLPEESAYTLYRLLRSNMKTKYVPVFGLAVKTDLHAQQQAQQLGFTAVVTKPIDISELEVKLAKAIDLDTSLRYFAYDEDYLVVRLPQRPTASVITEVTNYLKPKISDAVDNGYSKVIFDVWQVKRVDMELVKFLVEAMTICRELTLQYCLVGTPELAAECKGFEEATDWVFHKTVEDAKAKGVAVAG